MHSTGNVFSCNLLHYQIPFHCLFLCVVMMKNNMPSKRCERHKNLMLILAPYREHQTTQFMPGAATTALKPWIALALLHCAHEWALFRHLASHTHDIASACSLADCMNSHLITMHRTPSKGTWQPFQCSYNRQIITIITIPILMSALKHRPYKPCKPRCQGAHLSLLFNPPKYQPEDTVFVMCWQNSHITVQHTEVGTNILTLMPEGLV